nr:hypothetical protein [uncultured Cohaesibacter sp.]
MCLRKVLVINFFCLFWATSFACSAEQYGDGFRNYLRVTKLHKAFAISNNAAWQYVWGRATKEIAASDAVRMCNARQKAKGRVQECFVVHQDDSFVIPNGSRIMSVRMAIPVGLEIFDAVSGKSQNADGILVPDLKHGQTEISRKISLILSSGAPLCDGRYSIKEGGEAYSFRVKCFKQYNYKGYAKVRSWKRTGFFRTPVFDFKLETDRSYIRIKSLD